jgi:hypothetical protein
MSTASKKHIADGGRIDYSHGFDVLVGPEKEQFYVHHGVLVIRSGFFEAARSPDLLDDPHAPTELSEYDAEEFSDYLHLVYTGAIVLPDGEVSKWIEQRAPGTGLDTVGDAVSSHFSVLVKLYVLADKLQDPKSANLIMDGIVEFCKDCNAIPTHGLKKGIYELTPPGSPLRTLIRDLMIYQVGHDYYEEIGYKALPKELLFEIAREHQNIQKRHPQQSISEVYIQRVTDFPKCRYHQHNDEHPECEQ